MTNPFKVGDEVFTPSNRVVKVRNTYPGGCEVEIEVCGFSQGAYPTSYLSFKPWPAPCHERPIEDGWWICSDKTMHEPYPLIRKVFNGGVEFKVGSTTVKTNLHKWDFHKFLGKDWK